MKNDFRKRYIVFGVILILSQVTGCYANDTTAVKHQSEVEISPGKWLTVERESEVYKPEWEAIDRPKKNPHQLTLWDAIKQFLDSAPDSKAAETILNLNSAFTFVWNGKSVAWKGKEFPITLREHKTSLYIVGFNRQKIDACRLVFYKLGKEGVGFEVISPADFPRQIATQNMSMNLIIGERHVRVGKDLIDTWPVIRSLDITNRYFKLSLTAAMWYQLETGKEYYMQSRSDLTQQFLQDYVAKYKPIALPTIVREPTEQLTTNAVPGVMTNK
jgi:hypothetical protein